MWRWNKLLKMSTYQIVIPFQWFGLSSSHHFNSRFLLNYVRFRFTGERPESREIPTTTAKAKKIKLIPNYVHNLYDVFMLDSFIVRAPSFPFILVPVLVPPYFMSSCWWFWHGGCEMMPGLEMYRLLTTGFLAQVIFGCLINARLRRLKQV